MNTAVPFNASGYASDLDVRERLDVSYNGVTNWVFWGRGDFTEGTGNLNEFGGLIPIGGLSRFLPCKSSLTRTGFSRNTAWGAVVSCCVR